jgi:tetratricopeptide (TPR) repeat protein
MRIAPGGQGLYVRGVTAGLPSISELELLVGALFALLAVVKLNGRRRARRRRARVRWLVLGALAAGGAAFAFLGSPGHGTNVSATVPTPPRSHSVAARQEPASRPASARSSLPGSVLNDAGFALLRAGNYDRALPLLERAVKRLAGSGSLTDAYALYNLSATRFALGRCDGVLAMLAQSQKLQGRKPAIDSLRARAERRCR